MVIYRLDILRRPQKFRKNQPNFLTLVLSNVKKLRDFFKFLWPSQKTSILVASSYKWKMVFLEYLNFIILVCIFLYKINSTRVSSRNSFLAGHPNFFQFLWFSQENLTLHLFIITKYVLTSQVQITCNLNSAA